MKRRNLFIVIVVIELIAIVVLSVCLYKVNESLTNEKNFNEILSHVNAEFSSLELKTKQETADRESIMNDQINTLIIDCEQYEKELTEAENQIQDLLLQVEEKEKEIASLSEELGIKKAQADKEAYFEYALYTDGHRTDMTIEYIELLESLIIDKDVNDIDFYLCWIGIESSWDHEDRNPNSTAKGFAQFLNGTSEWVYNDMLDSEYKIGQWYPDIVVDHPDICLRMMVDYVDWLYQHNGHSLAKTIDSYRGCHDKPYLAKFNSYLAIHGKSLDSLAEEFAK